MDRVLLVDMNDNIIGTEEKMQAHIKPKLHRAFSVVLYDKNRVLIQRRAYSKYHSGGLWANTCCSHPRTPDTKAEALNRLNEETGITVDDIEEVFSFVYCTKFGDSLYEYEYDHVFVAEYSGEYVPNSEEVAEMKWIDVDQLLSDMTDHPNNYAVWFLSLMPRVAKIIKQKMS